MRNLRGKTLAFPIVPLLVALGASLVLAGWLFNIDPLKRGMPHWAASKTSVAVMFLIAAAVSMAMVRRPDNLSGVSWRSAIGAGGSMAIGLIVLDMAVAYLRQTPSTFDLLIVAEPANAIGTISPGRPSICTLVLFGMFTFAGFAATFGYPLLARAACLFIGLGGLVSVVGYATGTPGLICSLGGLSTEIAFPTSLLFVLLGFGVWCSTSVEKAGVA